MNRAERPHFDPEGGIGGGGGTPIFTPGKGLNGGSEPEAETKPKITAFKQALSTGHHESKWIRATNKTGTGATHVRSFHCKLNDDSLVYLDQQVNEWLDTHPDYEVKFVTTSVGEWTAKQKEPHMILQLWV